MALGDQRTYGTVQRVTPLTDGTLDSIHMANPGTTYEAGVMPGAWSLLADSVRQSLGCRPGVLNSYVGECAASSVCREANGDAARQWYPAPPRGGTGGLVEPAACIRAHEVVLGASSGHESSDRFYRSDVGPGNTAEWKSCLPVLARGGFRFKVVFGSDLEKHFGSDLMTDTRGVFKGSSGSVKGFEMRPPITWAAVC